MMRSDPSRLDRLQLPAIGARQDGGGLLLAKVAEDKVPILDPAQCLPQRS